MGFRYQKRIKLGKGFGLNISKSGISSSLKTKKGTISSKGYSIRTRIPGLTYRKIFSKSSKGGCVSMLIFFFSFLLIILIT